MKNACESCLMPADMDPGTPENHRYCSYCFKDGKLCFEGSLKEFKKRCYAGMRKNGMSALKARFFTWMVGFAPRWRKNSGAASQ